MSRAKRVANSLNWYYWKDLPKDARNGFFWEFFYGHLSKNIIDS